MKRTLKKTVKEIELVIGGRRLTNLRYADDTTLLASTSVVNKDFETRTRTRTWVSRTRTRT